MPPDDRLRDVRSWVREFDPDPREGAGDTPTLSFRRGSAMLIVAAFGGRDESPEMLRLSACVVRGVAAHTKGDLMAYLLRRNEELLFCGFSVDAEGDIWINGVLFSGGLDKKDFAFVVTEMTATADRCDDEIVRRWGGRRFSDA